MTTVGLSLLRSCWELPFEIFLDFLTQEDTSCTFVKPLVISRPQVPHTWFAPPVLSPLSLKTPSLHSLSGAQLILKFVSLESGVCKICLASCSGKLSFSMTLTRTLINLVRPGRHGGTHLEPWHLEGGSRWVGTSRSSLATQPAWGYVRSCLKKLKARLEIEFCLCSNK